MSELRDDQTIDRVSGLRTRITRIVRESTGMHEALALPIAEAICAELQAAFGVVEVYVPSQSRADRRQAILDDWQRGLSPEAIRQRHGVARSTLYRLIGARGR